MTGAYPVRRNALLLAAGIVCLSGMVQLAAAVATVTLVLVTGIEGILGLGPAIFLTASALAAGPAGRAMDRFGRMPVIRAGFAAGVAAGALTAAGCAADSAALVVAGFGLAGGASGIVLLSRAAAAEMFAPERRGRGVALVLFGAVFGALLGPLVFAPLFAGREVEAAALTTPWLAAAGVSLLALALVSLVRPDPRRIAELLRDSRADVAPAAAAPLREILGRPGVRPALLAALALPLLYWQLVAPVRDVVAAHGDPSVRAAYYAPLVEFLGRRGGDAFRVEIPFTRSHW